MESGLAGRRALVTGAGKGGSEAAARDRQRWAEGAAGEARAY